MHEQIRKLLAKGHSTRKVFDALGGSHQTVRRFERQRMGQEQPPQQSVSVALASPDADTKELASWEQAINGVALRAAVTSDATIKQLHVEQAPELSYTRLRRTLHCRAAPPSAIALRLTH
jgi:hypothetical protein